MRQEELRNTLKTVMLDEIDYNQMTKLADAIDGDYAGDSKGLIIAITDARASLDTALRKISRLAVRMGYIEKEKP